MSSRTTQFPQRRRTGQRISDRSASRRSRRAPPQRGETVDRADRGAPRRRGRALWSEIDVESRSHGGSSCISSAPSEKSGVRREDPRREISRGLSGYSRRQAKFVTCNRKGSDRGAPLNLPSRPKAWPSRATLRRRVTVQLFRNRSEPCRTKLFASAQETPCAEARFAQIVILPNTHVPVVVCRSAGIWTRGQLTVLGRPAAGGEPANPAQRGTRLEATTDRAFLVSAGPPKVGAQRGLSILPGVRTGHFLVQTMALIA